MQGYNVNRVTKLIVNDMNINLDGGMGARGRLFWFRVRGNNMKETNSHQEKYSTAFRLLLPHIPVPLLFL